ncbi:MAG: sugar transferase [Clostridia bacterium]|nr:sugar transferase [Clostridia bacterium]
MLSFDALPNEFKNDAVKKYYDIIKTKKLTCFFKRFFDFVIALMVFIVFLPIYIVCAILIKCTSEGPVFYRQVRVGRYGKEFRIFKFRTMVVNADKIGTQITVGDRDPRITKVGYLLRKTRLDEFPQVLNVLCGDMCLIGARPEVPKYVDAYTDEMMATLLLAPGISGMASLEFKNENEMLEGKEDPEKCYIEEILPIKMGINLKYIENMSLWLDIKILVRTFIAVFKHD